MNTQRELPQNTQPHQTPSLACLPSRRLPELLQAHLTAAVHRGAHCTAPLPQHQTVTGPQEGSHSVGAAAFGAFCHILLPRRCPSENFLQKAAQLLGPWLPSNSRPVARLLNHHGTGTR